MIAGSKLLPSSAKGGREGEAGERRKKGQQQMEGDGKVHMLCATTAGTTLNT